MSPASCEGGGVRSRQPGGGEGDLLRQDSGELGGEEGVIGMSSRSVRVETSETASLRADMVEGGRSRYGGKSEAAGRVAALSGKAPFITAQTCNRMISGIPSQSRGSLSDRQLSQTKHEDAL
jgi:hypothetical protein